MNKLEGVTGLIKAFEYIWPTLECLKGPEDVQKREEKAKGKKKLRDVGKSSRDDRGYSAYLTWA